ncbi:Ubiquitin carboxyl-terminal hydrolase [Sergentomyia squamirostris]
MPMITTRSSGTSCLPPSVGSSYLSTSTSSASKSRLGSSSYSSSLGDGYLTGQMIHRVGVSASVPAPPMHALESLSEASKFVPGTKTNNESNNTDSALADGDGGGASYGAIAGGQSQQERPQASTVTKVRVCVSPSQQQPPPPPTNYSSTVVATCNNNNTEMLSTTNTTKTLENIHSTSTASGSSSASHKRPKIVFGSTYRDQNFLKPECDLARSQVVRSTDPENNNNDSPNLLVQGNRLTTRSDSAKPQVHTPKFRGRLQIVENGNGRSELEEIRNTILKAYKPINPDDADSGDKSPSDSSDDIKFIDSDESEYQKITQKIATLPFAASRRTATTSSSSSTETTPNGYSTLNTVRSFSKKASSSATDEPPNDKISGNVLEVNGSIRSPSLRSALPPVSPVRSWDRPRYRELYDSDYKTSSTLSTSSILKDAYDKVTTDNAEGLCGLRNIGNTCFMNSVIQCLSHTSDLTSFLKSQRDPKSVTKDQRIFSEFVKLIKEMWSVGCRSVTPSDLKSAFSSKHRMYSGCAQQDAQEFLRFFLDSLHSALNEGTKAEGVQLADNLNDSRKADLMWEWYSKTEKSMIKDLFVGQLKSTLKCTVCGNTSVTFDPFWDLSLPLPSSSTKNSKLENCLELFIREEILDGDEMPTCSKCQTRRKSTKSLTIQRFPKYLVIHLKRFSETRWSKLTNIIEFPTSDKELNLTPYASTSNYSSTLYSLYAISNHMGSTGGGHYVALCKHPQTGKWHEFDDNIVRDVTESSLISSSAYLLFYERV